MAVDEKIDGHNAEVDQETRDGANERHRRTVHHAVAQQPTGLHSHSRVRVRVRVRSSFAQ